MMRFSRWTESAALLVLALGAPLIQAARAQGIRQSTAQVTDSVQIIEPGDILQVTVWRHPELSGQFVASADGTLKHPLFQDARVVGLTLSAARRRIGDVISRYEQNAPFTVEPMFRVAVGGDVRNPSLLVVPRETTILQAIQMAGGPDDRGRMDRVQLIRRGESIDMDLLRVDNGDAQKPIVSGDQIIVGHGIALWHDILLPAVPVISSVLSIYYLARRL